MTSILNTKGVSDKIVFETLESNFASFVNDGINTDLTFEFTKNDNYILVSVPSISQIDRYMITVTEDIVTLTNNSIAYKTELLDQKLESFIHAVVD